MEDQVTMDETFETLKCLNNVSLQAITMLSDSNSSSQECPFARDWWGHNGKNITAPRSPCRITMRVDLSMLLEHMACKKNKPLTPHQQTIPIPSGIISCVWIYVFHSWSHGFVGSAEVTSVLDSKSVSSILWCDLWDDFRPCIAMTWQVAEVAEWSIL